MVPRIYSQNNAARLSTLLLFLFASITSFGQNPPSFAIPGANCPGVAMVTIPMGASTLVFSNANIEALLGSTAVDPNGDPVTYSASPSSVSCSDVGGGPVLITVTASDNEIPAMTATCVDIAVTVSSGGGLPSAVCQNITVNLSGGGLVVPADIDGGSFSCSGITMMMVNDGGGSAASKTYVCGDVGIQTLDLEITDAFGTSTCTANITVVDDIDPTFTCPLDQTETLDANCNIVIPDLLTGIVDEADACGAVTMAQSPTAGTLVPSSDGGTTAVTITATDVNGNTATCMVTLTGDDTTPPNAICLATLTVDLDAGGNYTLTAAELNGGSSDNCGTTNLSIPATSFTCADIATSPHVVTLTVNDGNGNMSTCMTSVTVQDGAGTPPPPLSNLTANNNFNDCEATVSFPNTAPDNCGTYPVIINSATHEKGSTILILTSVGNYFGDFPIGITTINYSITDGGGNTTTADFTITVFDDEAPNVICPSTQTLNFANCNSANEMLPDYRSLLGVTDNCPVNQFVNIEQVPAPGTLLSAISTPADAEVIVVTFNVSDVNPSMTNMGSTCSFSVILNEDNTPTPNVLGAILAPINSECGPIIIDVPTATDECGNIICGEPFPSVATLVTPCSVGPGGTGSLSETINPEPDVSIPDNNTSGNFSTGTVTAPAASSITDVNVTIDINHTWVGDLEATLTSPDGTVVELFNRPGVPAGTFGCAGNDLDVTFDDEATNTATDFENSCGNLPAITGSFQSTIPMSNFDGETPTGDWTLTVVDNAGGDLGVIASWTLDIEYSQPGGNLAQYEFPVGTHNITWNYDDGFGNTATQQQVITVTDDIVGPEITCQDIELELDAFGNASIINDDVIAPSAIELTGSNLTPCFNPVADTETDFSLMVSSAVTFDFDWDYFTLDGPAFDPFGYTVDGVYTELTNPGGSNSQSGSASVSLTAGQTFSFRAYTFDNTCGGSVTQIMNFSPGFTGDYSIGNWALSNTNGGNGDITDILDGMATDNCSDPADILLSLSQSNFDCSDLGANTVTLTATDEAGNSSQCTATVTIVDNIAPTLSGIPGDVTVACNAIPAVATGVTANDNCSTVGIIFNEISTQVLDESLCQYYTYEITRIWTVEDQSGNSVTETQVITVQDNQDPIFASLNFPSTVTANAAAGSCNALVSLVMTSADVLDLPGCVSFDNLTITNDGNGAGSADASGTYPVGSTPVTFTVTDPCGNSSSYTVNVNVTDNTPPIAACNSISVGIPDGQDSIIIDASLIALIDNGSFDNCAGTAVDLSVSPNVFYCSQIADGTQDEFDITLAVTVPGSGDTTFCETTITIQDNNAPNITCIDPLVITLDANGTATATPAMLNGGIDDCSDIMTIELTGNIGFDLTDIGSHPISDGITPTLQVTDVHGNVETCTPTTLIVTPPTTCLTSVDVIDNGEVEIPYTSTNFTNVIGFQFSMQVDDETVATFAQDNAANLCGAVTINVPNLSGIHQSLICNGTFTNQISIDGKVLSVSWFNTTPNPVSITDGEPLFNFRIDALGVVGDMTTFSITGAPYANELTTKYGNDILEDTPPLCVSPIGNFEVGDNATLPISGNVSTWNRTRIDTIGYDTISTMPLVTNPILDTVILIAGQGLANASLVKMETVLPFGATTTTDTDMTDANGDYTVQVANLAGGVALNLVPRKNNPNWLNNGDVNSSDLFFIQQHIVNNIPFSSIYDYVAADVNESGTITTLDLVLIQDVIVNPEISPIPSSVIDAYNPWRFIQREYAESDLDPFDLDPSISLPAQPMAPVVPASEQNRTYNPAVLPMANTDWIAVKVGQIFGGLNTSTLTNNDVEDRTGENFVMSVENQKVRNGELISIPVYAKDYAAFIAWQFTLEFNENYLEYHGMLPGAIAGFGENKLGLNAVEEGIIGAIWYGTPNSVKSDEVLFTLQFTALDDADALSGLIDVTSRTVKSQSSLMSGATGEVSITFFSPAIATATDFELHQNRPNPFNGETLISFNLPEAGFARVIISDISGRTLKVVEGDYAKGYNEVRIQSNDFSSTGVLYYQLESAEHIATKKMIILE
jgi:subtilisin-like proprotein convertase family protein